MFDTEKPPMVREGLGDPSGKRRVLQLDFSENLDALPPFAEWLRSGNGPIIRPWGFWKDGAKFVKANKWFASRGHHPCS